MTDVAFDHSLDALRESMNLGSSGKSTGSKASGKVSDHTDEIAILKDEVRQITDEIVILKNEVGQIRSDADNLEGAWQELKVELTQVVTQLSEKLIVTPAQMEVFFSDQVDALNAKLDSIEAARPAAIEKVVQELQKPPAVDIMRVAVGTATARKRWQTSYVVLALTAAAALVGALWVIWLQLDDQAIDHQGKPTTGAWGVRVGGLLACLALMLVLWVVLTIGDHTSASGVARSRLYGYVTEKFLPLDGFAGVVDRLTLFAVIGVGVSVGFTLLVPQPFERIFSGFSNKSEGRMAKQCKEYLTRCFERLRVLIYLGGVLLTVAVFHVVAVARWPIALLSGEDNDDTFTKLIAALEGLISELGFSYGAVLSILLLAILLPTSIMLRRRAWRLARDENHGAKVEDGGDPATTAEDQAEWLKKNRLQVSIKGILAQIVAVASPVLAGTLGSVVLQGIEATAGG